MRMMLIGRTWMCLNLGGVTSAAGGMSLGCILDLVVVAWLGAPVWNRLLLVVVWMHQPLLGAPLDRLVQRASHAHFLAWS